MGKLIPVIFEKTKYAVSESEIWLATIIPETEQKLINSGNGSMFPGKVSST